MPGYVIRNAEMRSIMGLLYRVLDIRITFFDMTESEVDTFDIKAMSAFCRKERESSAFNRRCQECDRTHLDVAKHSGKVHIYRCHAGLLEGIVPLYAPNGHYMGAIVFGQLCDEMTPARVRLQGVPVSNSAQMYDIGALLKYLGEYICENEYIKSVSRPWAERAQHYLEEKLPGRITLSALARAIGKSPSFLSHHFPEEFGMTLTEYCRKWKMEKAMQMLRRGCQVRECAFALAYADEFYFSREFKRYYGVPPSQC